MIARWGKSHMADGRNVSRVDPPRLTWPVGQFQVTAARRAMIKAEQGVQASPIAHSSSKDGADDDE